MKFRYWILVISIFFENTKECVSRSSRLENRKNSCKNVKDFDTLSVNKNCWYNPEADMSLSAIVRKYGYPLQSYEVETEDGFFLQIFRIPHGLKNKNDYERRQPVLLQHGFMTNWGTFVAAGNASLGFLLADKGYDVWMANARGTTYSLRHKKYTKNSPQFWDWSLDEIGIYDFPSSLDKVIEKTGRKDIIVITYSIGVIYPSIYGALKPLQAKNKIKLIINVAPALFLGESQDYFSSFTPFEKNFKELADHHGFYEILSQTPQFRRFWENFCYRSSRNYVRCMEILSSGDSIHHDRIFPETLSMILGHAPAGVSTGMIYQLSQFVNTDKFMMFDHGKKENLIKYKSENPPEYNITKIEIPSYLIYAANDPLVPDHAVNKLYENLPKESRLGIYKIKDENFKHVDFAYSKNVVWELYTVIFDVLSKFAQDS